MTSFFASSSICISSSCFNRAAAASALSCGSETAAFGTKGSLLLLLRSGFDIDEDDDTFLCATPCRAPSATMDADIEADMTLTPLTTNVYSFVLNVAIARTNSKE